MRRKCRAMGEQPGHSIPQYGKNQGKFWKFYGSAQPIR